MFRSLFKNIFQTVSAVIILLTAFAYLSPFVNPATFRWFSYFGTAFPWFLLINIAFLIFWATRLNRFALYHFTIILLGWSYTTKFVGMHSSSGTIPQKGITILTHNLGAMFGGKKVSEPKMDSIATAYASFLQKNGTPDIICTQETRGAFYPLLGKHLGYDQRFNLKKGTVILSRYPIKAGGDIPFGKTSNSTLWADIELPDGSITRIYNVHLQSNKVTQDADKVIEDPEKQDWTAVRRIMNKVGGATSTRSEQAQQLREHILNCKYPVIVCGDFNDTPNSYVYHHISEGLTDAFEVGGWGRGTTFAGRLPLLRIDYILTDPGFPVYSSRVVRDSRWSDHYPVWAVLETGK